MPADAVGEVVAEAVGEQEAGMGVLEKQCR